MTEIDSIVKRLRYAITSIDDYELVMTLNDIVEDLLDYKEDLIDAMEKQQEDGNTGPNPDRF